MNHYFHNRHILIGITGSIAAYKTLELISRLRQLGSLVRVILTESARQFLTPVSITTLCNETVYTDLFSDPLIHIELAKWAELILIAPATANVMAKYAQGFADDLLCSVLLASPAKVAIAPAMNQLMWAHPATQDNAEILKKRGTFFIGPATGIQACGDSGIGRMSEVDAILDILPRLWQAHFLSGKKVLITAGPTEEDLDPVRYITNHSSGKMGFALARSAYYHGGEVILVSGPNHLKQIDFCETIAVRTADEMRDAVLSKINGVDLLIGCAAICDFKPVVCQDQKIKKSGTSFSLELKQNPDLLTEIGALPKKPFLVGFAAETENLLIHAKKKLDAKNLDLIIANQVGPQQGFNEDDNEITILSRDEMLPLPKATKSVLADQILEVVNEHLARIPA